MRERLRKYLALPTRQYILPVLISAVVFLVAGYSGGGVLPWVIAGILSLLSFAFSLTDHGKSIVYFLLSLALTFFVLSYMLASLEETVFQGILVVGIPFGLFVYFLTLSLGYLLFPDNKRGSFWAAFFASSLYSFMIWFMAMQKWLVGQTTLLCVVASVVSIIIIVLIQKLNKKFFNS